jgi:hypothetical protein
VEHGAHFLILYYPVPNLSITIRNCFIAVRRRGCCANDPGTSNRAPRVSARRPLDTLERVEVSTNANLRALCVLDTGKGKGAWATLRLSLPVRVRARASPRLSHCVPLTAPLSLCLPHRVSLTVSPSPRLSLCASLTVSLSLCPPHRASLSVPPSPCLSHCVSLTAPLAPCPPP